MRKANREIKDEQLMRQTLETADTGKQFFEGEGLNHIIISSTVQSCDFVLKFAEGG